MLRGRQGEKDGKTVLLGTAGNLGVEEKSEGEGGNGQVMAL